MKPVTYKELNKKDIYLVYQIIDCKNIMTVVFKLNQDEIYNHLFMENV